MSAIGTRTFAEGDKKCLVLGSEEFVRPLAYGSAWNWLRIMFSYAITPNGTSNITGARWVVGLCAGMVQGRTYNSSNTSNYIGCLLNHTDESAGRDLLYTANSGNPYYRQGTDRGSYFTRVGSTTSKATFATSGGLPAMPTTTGGAIQRRGIMAVDILRPTAQGSGTANWAIRNGSTMDATVAALDIQREMIYFSQFALSAPGDPFTLGYGSGLQWTDLVNPVTPPDEAANGYFDTVSIFWNKSAFPLEIYDIAVFRIR